MRIVYGNQWNFSDDIDERFELLKPLVHELPEEATQVGILISTENHADIPVRILMNFIESSNSPYLGLCFDLGNAIRVGDDPTALIDLLGIKRIFKIQVKDVLRVKGHEDPIGWWPTIPFGTGDVNLKSCILALQSKGYKNPLIMELTNLFSRLEDVEVAKSALTFLRDELGSEST